MNETRFRSIIASACITARVKRSPGGTKLDRRLREAIETLRERQGIALIGQRPAGGAARAADLCETLDARGGAAGTAAVPHHLPTTLPAIVRSDRQPSPHPSNC